MNDRELADQLESEVDASDRVARGWVAVPLAKAREIIAALRRSQPEGMVMVPREPTQAMCDRFYDNDTPEEDVDCFEGFKRGYRAMLSAAEAEGRKG